jgi:hypothetical protein
MRRCTRTSVLPVRHGQVSLLHPRSHTRRHGRSVSPGALQRTVPCKGDGQRSERKQHRRPWLLEQPISRNRFPRFRLRPSLPTDLFRSRNMHGVRRVKNPPMTAGRERRPVDLDSTLLAPAPAPDRREHRSWPMRGPLVLKMQQIQFVYLFSKNLLRDLAWWSIILTARRRSVWFSRNF